MGKEVRTGIERIDWRALESITPQVRKARTMLDGLQMDDDKREALHTRLGAMMLMKDEIASKEWPSGRGLCLIIDLNSVGFSDPSSSECQAFLQQLPDLPIGSSDRVVGMPMQGKGNYYMVGVVEARAGERLGALADTLLKKVPNVKIALVEGEFTGQGADFHHGIEKGLADDMFAKLPTGGLVCTEEVGLMMKNPHGSFLDERLFSIFTAEQLLNLGIGDMGGRYFEAKGLLPEVKLAHAGPPELVGYQEELGQMHDFVRNPAAKVAMVRGAMGVGKSRIINEVQKGLRGEADFIDLSFPPQAKDPSVAACDYFGFTKLAVQLGAVLKKKMAMPDYAYLAESEKVRYLVDLVVNKTEAEQLELMRGGYANYYQGAVLEALEWLRHGSAHKENELVVVCDDLHYLADQKSREVVSSILTSFNAGASRYRPGSQGKFIFAGRPKQFTEHGDRLVDELRAGVPLTEVELHGLPLSTDFNLANQFAVRTLRYDLADTKFDEAQLVRISKVAQNLPLAWVMFLNRWQREGRVKVDNSTGVSVLRIDEGALKQVEQAAASGQILTGSEVEADLGTLLFDLRESDPQAFRFMSLLAVLGGEFKVPASGPVVPMATGALKQVLGFGAADQKWNSISEMMESLEKGGFVEMDPSGETYAVRFAHEQFTHWLSERLKTGDDYHDLALEILNNETLALFLDNDRKIRLYEDVAAHRYKHLTTEQWSDFETVVTEWFERQLEVVRDYNGASREAKRLLGLPKLDETGAVMDDPDGLNTEGGVPLFNQSLRDLVNTGNPLSPQAMESGQLRNMIINLLACQTRAEAEKASPYVDHLIGLLTKIRDRFKEEIDLIDGATKEEAEKLDYIVNKAIFYAEDRKAKPNGRGVLLPAYQKLKQYEDTHGQGDSELGLMFAKLDYRRGRFDEALGTLSELYEPIAQRNTAYAEENAGWWSPEMVEWVRLWVRISYERARDKSIYLYEEDREVVMEGVEYDVKNYHALWGLADGDPEKLEAVFEEWMGKLEFMELMASENPAIQTERSRRTTADMMAGISLMRGDWKKAREVATKEARICYEADSLVDMAARFDHFVVMSHIMEALEGRLEGEEEINPEAMLAGIKHAISALMRLEDSDVAKGNITHLLLRYDLLRIFQWMGRFYKTSGNRALDVQLQRIIRDLNDEYTNYGSTDNNQWLSQLIGVDGIDGVSYEGFVKDIMIDTASRSFASGEPDPELAYSYCGALGYVNTALAAVHRHVHSPQMVVAAMTYSPKYNQADKYGERDTKLAGLKSVFEGLDPAGFNEEAGSKLIAGLEKKGVLPEGFSEAFTFLPDSITWNEDGTYNLSVYERLEDDSVAAWQKQYGESGYDFDDFAVVPNEWDQSPVPVEINGLIVNVYRAQREFVGVQDEGFEIWHYAAGAAEGTGMAKIYEQLISE